MHNNIISLERVQYLPEQLSPSVLYLPEKYSVAGHLCACGCGNKVIMPLGPAEWSFSESNGQPFLRPLSASGNWPAGLTTSSMMATFVGRARGLKNGRRAEEQRRQAYAQQALKHRL